MQKFIDQATHNQSFHDCVEREFKDKFYDWKITALFYIAIHCLKALADKKGINIGTTHREIEQSVNPARQNAVMRISNNAWGEYKALYQYSRSSRYDGITDFDTFEILKQVDHTYCLEHIKRFKDYIKGQGVPL